MKQESLDKTLTAIVMVLKDLDIDDVDRAELMLNLYHLLKSKEDYQDSLEVLQSKRLRKR